MRAALRDFIPRRYGGSIGASATIYREPGQARKGAAEAVDLCAGVLLVESPPDFPLFLQFPYLGSDPMTFRHAKCIGV